jgi:hypothetical protein
MSIGPFRAGELMRIPLAVTLNGQAISVANARVQRLIDPVGNDIAGYPKYMITVEDGVYYLEVQLFQTGNYTAIIRAELSGETLEDIEPFVVEPPNGLPRIECG